MQHQWFEKVKSKMSQYAAIAPQNVRVNTYKLRLDLIGNTSLQQLSLEVYWKDKLSVLHPLTLDAGSSSDLLCMLRRKTYNY
jgi:hypothetical protein